MWIETNARTEKWRTVVLALTCLAIVLFAAPYRPGIVLGESMSPAFHSGQVFLTSRVGDPNALCKGDVVLFSLNGQLFLKRIYAVGGQRVWALLSSGSSDVVDCIVPPTELNAIKRMNDSRRLSDLVEITVPPDHIYVLGDSQFNSLDSRRFGPVPVKNIRGRIVVSHLFSLWSPKGRAVALAAENRE